MKNGEQVCLTGERQEVAHFLIPSPVGSQGGDFRGETVGTWWQLLSLSAPRPISCVEDAFPPPHIHICLP